MSLFRFACLAASLGLGAPALAQDKRLSDPIAQAMKDEQRRPANIALDADRKPAKIIKMLGVKPGMRVAEMFGGNRYWSELLAPVVGARGTVILWQPEQFASDEVRAGLSDLHDARPNVKPIYSRMERPNLAPRSLDRMLLNLDYHDVYWQSAQYGVTRMEPQAWLAILYQAMRPGGEILVVDHRGPEGDTRAIVEATHRIAPSVVRADFEKAGFQLVKQSNLYRTKSDDLSKSVFDPAVRGKTDRFIMKFRRPK